MAQISIVDIADTTKRSRLVEGNAVFGPNSSGPAKAI
jgi:hypothetical protein